LLEPCRFRCNFKEKLGTRWVGKFQVPRFRDASLPMERPALRLLDHRLISTEEKFRATPHNKRRMIQEPGSREGKFQVISSKFQVKMGTRWNASLPWNHLAGGRCWSFG
jgi:hypothetical protein